jgi:ParB-like chromosome segregation protein Spo0J
MLVRVPIDRIEANPWQTRGVDGYGGIEDLARSIKDMRQARPETSGLLQVPPARLWDADGEMALDPVHLDGPEEVVALVRTVRTNGAVVQLAAGHRRWQAFCHLARDGLDLAQNLDDVGITVSNALAEYWTFPVELQVLDDEQMATIAWVENEEREDVNPIGKARAIEAAMARFGWTQATVGERWNLSRSGVANLLRLLNLPDDAKGAVERGEISQRHGRVLLSALGKSRAIYERMVERVVPLAAPEEDVVEKAKEQVEKRQYRLFARLSLGDVRPCAACGIEISGDGHSQHARSYDHHEWRYLCLACYRAGTGWTPPSISGAEELLRDSERLCRNRLSGASFPHDVEIGAPSPLAPQLSGEGIWSARCTECAYVDGDWCLDERCFDEKTALWRANERIRFEEQCQVMFGAVPEICEGYGGYDLRTRDETDVGLIRDGICVPGKCERLRFKRTVRVFDSDVCPVPGMPFIYNCNNSQSHKACQRRYLESQRTEDEAKAERAAKRRASANRKKAAERLEQMAHVVAKRIYDRDDALWYQLARQFDYKVEREQPVDVYLWRIAVTLAGEVPEYIDWEDEDALEQFETECVEDRLKELQIQMPATVDDVATRLERIKGFVFGEDGELRADLSPEQVNGNLTNLEKLTLELAEMQGTDSMSEQDFSRLDEEIDYVWETLQALSVEREQEAASVSGKQ